VGNGVNETPSSQAKGGISYSPECHICPQIRVLFQPTVEDPQGCGPLGLAIISLYLVSPSLPTSIFREPHQINCLVMDHMNALLV